MFSLALDMGVGGPGYAIAVIAAMIINNNNKFIAIIGSGDCEPRLSEDGGSA